MGSGQSGQEDSAFLMGKAGRPGQGRDLARKWREMERVLLKNVFNSCFPQVPMKVSLFLHM